MSSKSKFFLAICFIILDMFLILGFLIVRNATMVNTLKKEVLELNKLDVTRDRFNRKIVCKGEYAVVEGAIKEYLDDYAVSLQDVLKIVDDPNLSKILSYDNYSKDGPDFVNSLDYLKTTKDSFNENIDSLVSNLEEENIIKFIKEKEKNQYYVDLYTDLMLNDDMKDSFEETKKLLVKNKAMVNNALDVSTDVINFLVSNKGEWILDNGQIKFNTNEQFEYYNNLIMKVNAK